MTYRYDRDTVRVADAEVLVAREKGRVVLTIPALRVSIMMTAEEARQIGAMLRK